MEYPEYNWKKEVQISVDAYPGKLPEAQGTNIYEKQMEAGNPDAIAYDQQVVSLINERGYPVLYYPYLYEISKTEQLYGEHSAASYGKPFKIYMTLEIKDAPSWVENGMAQNNETFTGNIHIRTFREQVRDIVNDGTDERSCPYSVKYNPNYKEEKDWVHAIEPTPKDLIQLMLWGVDREEPRGNRIFEITNVEDEILSENFNQNFGHYVWKVTGVRYRYSYEDNLSNRDPFNEDNPYIGQMGEKGNYQVFENQPVVKMFLADNDVLTEQEGNMPIEDGTLLIATERGPETVVQRYDKIYNDGNNIEELSKQVNDMTEENEGIYDNPVKHVESNGYF